MKCFRKISGFRNIFGGFILLLALAGCSGDGHSADKRTESINDRPKSRHSDAYEEDMKKFRAVVEAQEKENERRAAESKREYEELLEREKRQ